MNRKTEEELRRMFKEIQVPFHKYCPPIEKIFYHIHMFFINLCNYLSLMIFALFYVIKKQRKITTTRPNMETNAII